MVFKSNFNKIGQLGTGTYHIEFKSTYSTYLKHINMLQTFV